MKKIIKHIVVLMLLPIILLNTAVLFGHNIPINQTFEQDGQVYEFLTSDPIYSCKLTGDISLNSDIGMIRVILVTETNEELLIYEAFPSILDNSSLTNVYYETAYLDGIVPAHIKVQIIDASITISSFSIEDSYIENALQLQESEKSNIEDQRVQLINDYIEANGLLWYAGITPKAEMSFENKRNLFEGGELPNFQGLEYYVGGFFNIGEGTPPPPGLITNFDWRARHGANKPSSPYFDGDDTNWGGWIPPRFQTQQENDCFAQAPTYSIEALCNVYFNQHLDINLSQQDVISCFTYGPWGGGTGMASHYIVESGIVNEGCFPYQPDPDEPPPPCSEKCTSPDELISADSYDWYYGTDVEENTIKLDIIDNGPSPAKVTPWGHAMMLLGYGTVDIGDEILDGNNQHTGIQILVEPGSPFIGMTYWIFEQSWGSWNNGTPFLYVIADKSKLRVHLMIEPISRDGYSSNDIQCLDEDNDGYYNWGIADIKPPSCDNCPDEPDCDDSNPILGPFGADFNCQLLCENFTYNATPYYINNNTTFEDIQYFDSDIIITAGNELIVEGEIGMVEGAKIVVMPEAKLTVDGGIITSTCENIWQGIEVWGDPNLSQYEYDGVCQQGIIELKNGATIENANVGVLLGAIDDEGNNDYSKGGGIIKADFVDNENEVANFINNKWGVRFMPYHNFKIGYPPEYEVSNLSFIENCTFEVNSNYLMGDWTNSHIHLFDVDGIKIKANTFTYSLTQNPSGHGINGWKAGFRISSICDSQLSPCPEGSLVNNTFTNFTKGVNLHIPDGNLYTASIKNSEFYENSNGIVLTGVNNASLLFNKFELGESDDNDAVLCNNKSAAYGIDMTDCMGFAVEENDFAKATGATLGNYIGIRVTDCPTESDIIYKNSFTGVSVGDQAEGTNGPLFGNSGITYFCNENIGNSYDFYVAINSRIATYQGYYDDATGNTLSSDAVVQFQNDSPENPIIYFFNQAEPDEVLNNYSEGVFPISTNDENTCPSNYGGISHEDPKRLVLTPGQKLGAEQDYAANLTNFNNVKALFDNLKDGGNTEATLTDVTTAWPNDMWELRAKLLGDSPHLSMEVLKAAADKTDVLPESVLFEILSANPDELKKEELIKYLEDKQNPLPAYMVDILRQLANGNSYKTVLLSEMAAYNAKKVGAAQDIVRSILNSDEPNMDELRNWLDNIGGMEADKQIIGTYISEGNYTSAQSLIDMLPGLYELEGDALLAYNDYKTFTEMMMDLEQGTRTIFDLNETEIATIVDLAENGYGSAKTSAQGLLEFAYGHDYCNCPDLPEGIGLKSSKATIDLDKLAQARGLDINVEPNPTSTWAAFDYSLPATASEAVIQISDNSGKIVQQVNIAQQQGQYVLDTRNYKAGIYYYTIICGDLQRTGKLIVQ